MARRACRPERVGNVGVGDGVDDAVPHRRGRVLPAFNVDIFQEQRVGGDEDNASSGDEELAGDWRRP